MYNKQTHNSKGREDRLREKDRETDIKRAMQSVPVGDKE